MSAGRAILFDLDGCLVDSFPSIARCWSETLLRFGHAAPSAERVRGLIGPPVEEVARALVPGADATTVEAVVADYRARTTAATDVDLFAGVRVLVEALAGGGLTLAIATSKSLEVVVPLLARLKLSECFAVVEGTHAGEPGADKALVVSRVLDRLGAVEPVALVGDRRYDVAAAHAHGLEAIGALWGYGGERELRQAGADRLAAAPLELLDLVGTDQGGA